MRELDPAEAADGSTDPQTLADPPDRLLGSSANSRVTPREQRMGPSLNERIAAEVTEDPPKHVGRLVDPESEDQLDVTAELVAHEVEPDAIDLSAEEAAMHEQRRV